MTFAPIAFLLGPVFGPTPSARLIRATAKAQWRLLAVNLTTSVLEAFSEGGSLAVIFLAVELLAEPAGGIDLAGNPILSRMPPLAALLEGLPRNGAFLLLLALAVLLQGVQALSRYLNQVSTGYLGARCRATVTARIHSQILGFSYPFASRYRVGDLTDHAGAGPRAVQVEIERLAGMVVTLLMIATYLVILTTLSPWLLVVALALGAVIVLIQRRLLPRIRRQSRRVSQAQVEISSRAIEDIQGLRLLHSSGQLDAADLRLRRRMGELEALLRRQVRLMSLIGPLSGFLPILAISLLAALSLVVFGARSTGVLPSLVTFVLALQRLNGRFASLAGSLNSLAENSGRLERLNHILDPAGKQFRRLGGVPFRGLEREIRLEAVSLRYAPELEPALREVDLVLPRGRTLALVGASGAGKSSIADLVAGLYTPSSGRVLVDGVDLRELDLASWQSRLGVVSQDTFLFNASLADNIAFGCAESSRERIEAAAAAAQAAGFIAALPDGYDTLVGERGYRLSGGQRQRISLARAILRNPELLILDEATSALDSHSERLVQQAIEAFDRDHTVLVIAHRLSTIVNADEICVLDGGRILERGRHPELLERPGAYRALWEQQHSRPLEALR